MSGLLVGTAYSTYPHHAHKVVVESIAVTVNPGRTVLDGDVVFRHEIQLPSLLAHGLWRFHEICECSIVCANDYGWSQQMLPEFFEAVHKSEQFFASYAVTRLRWCECCSASIAIDTQFAVLLLLKNSIKGCVRHCTCSVKHILSFIVWHA